jgi:signal transduction histidine kinase
MNLAAPSWRQLSRDDLRLLSTIAYQLGIAVERARLAEAATQLARAEERARIAREIHDTLAQSLTAIGLQIEGALQQMDSNPQRARQRLEDALATSRLSLDEARRSVLDLRGGAQARPLPDALAALARSFTSETGVRVRVQTEGQVVLPLRVEAELVRIAQEALTNVRRHARATEVEVKLRAVPRGIRLTIRDNGRGFHTQLRKEGHHGLLGMRERDQSTRTRDYRHGGGAGAEGRGVVTRLDRVLSHDT